MLIYVVGLDTVHSHCIPACAGPVIFVSALAEGSTTLVPPTSSQSSSHSSSFFSSSSTPARPPALTTPSNVLPTMDGQFYTMLIHHITSNKKIS